MMPNGLLLYNLRCASTSYAVTDRTKRVLDISHHYACYMTGNDFRPSVNCFRTNQVCQHTTHVVLGLRAVSGLGIILQVRSNYVDLAL